MRRYVVEIEEFYTLLSGEDVELNGCVVAASPFAFPGNECPARIQFPKGK